MEKKLWFYLFLILILIFSGFLGWFFYSHPSPQLRPLEEKPNNLGLFSTPEKVMETYIKAYQNENVVTLLKLYSDEWFSRKKIIPSQLRRDILLSLKKIKKNHGPIVKWDFPQFDVYKNTAIIKSYVRRKDGKITRSIFILVKEKEGWRILDIISLR